MGLIFEGFLTILKQKQIVSQLTFKTGQYNSPKPTWENANIKVCTEVANNANYFL